MYITLKINYKAMSIISKQFELIKMSNKNIYGFKHFLNIESVPDARMFTGNAFHSRGAAGCQSLYPKLVASIYIQSWFHNFSIAE